MSGVGLAARWQPALAFGGDCYDAMRVSESHLAISIADVCGKGLPAALLMSNLLASLRAFGASSRAARDVVTSVNRALCRQKDLRRFVTLFYAVYDSTTRVLTYTNAGHNPPLVLRHNGSCERLATGGTVTGIFDESTYEEGRVMLAPGDRLVLFTDGLIERRDASLDFGMDVLKDALNEVARLAPGAAAEWLAQRISPGIDDVAIIVVDLVDG